MFHILLDFLVKGDTYGIMLFYHFSTEMFGLNLLSGLTTTTLAGIDAIILLLWLWHEEIKHKISDYI